MKGIELLSLTNEQRKLLEASELNYRRFARVYFAVLKVAPDEIVVKVWQQENPSGKYLTVKELIERAKEVFSPVLPENIPAHYRPIPFRKDDLKEYSIEDVEKDMAELGIQTKDLVKLIDVDKASLSRLLNHKELTKYQKAMFYYLFKYLKSK